MIMQRMAIYDLDRTVTVRPTYTLFLFATAWRLAPFRFLLAPLLGPIWVAHKLGLYSRDRLKSLMWATMLGPVHPSRLDDAVAAFAQRMLAGNIRPGARTQLARDRADGAMLVLATAAHELYAAPIAEALGFDAVVATRMQARADGRIGPHLHGANVYGMSKLDALLHFQRDREAPPVPMAFYSDSSTDLPVFDWVDRAVAVNPSRRLERLALDRGWPIVDWGRP
jgi:HAD superfamily phosphoserine phosphatase-like hydrolase